MLLRGRSAIRYVQSTVRRALLQNRPSLVYSTRNYADVERPPRELYDIYSHKLQIDEKLTKMGRRPFGALVEEPIIVKKFFISKVDNEQLLYPEVISKHRINELNDYRQNIQEYFDNGILFDDNGISDSMHEQFKKLNIYGFNVPQKYGGYECSYSEMLLLTEPEGRFADVSLALNNHRMVCKNILEYGSQEQCNKYLPKLASGELIATTAFEEWNKDDLVGLTTKADFDDEENTWTLNGKK